MMLLGTETVCGSEDISGNISLPDTVLSTVTVAVVPGVDESSTTVVLVLLLVLRLHDHYQS